AGTGGGTERGGSVGARGSGGGGDRARGFHGGRVGKRTGRGDESRWDAERIGFRCEPGFGAVPLCHGRGADLARGSGRKTGGGAAAPAGGRGDGDPRRGGRGGALRGRSSGPDRRCDAGERGGAWRVGRRGARRADGGRGGQPGWGDGGGAVEGAGRQGRLCDPGFGFQRTAGRCASQEIAPSRSRYLLSAACVRLAWQGRRPGAYRR